MNNHTIAKLRKAGLCGRGGAAFPTWKKWELVKGEKTKKKYIVCNAAEGEPGIRKDHYILKHYLEDVVEGVKIALKTFDNSLAFIYLRKDYYQEFKSKLEELTNSLPITLFKKPGGYLAGEETTVVSAIEGKRLEPRIRPPFPCEKGIFGYPTLVNNLETFYHIAKIDRGEYKKSRFYTVSGDVKNQGVFELPEDWTIKQILKESKNYPVRQAADEFYIQSGGAISGEILLPSELEQKVRGQGGIVVYDRKKTDPFSLMKRWADFFYKENCDKCVPCREGVYRINKMLEKGKIDKEILDDLFLVMEETSFCALGQAVVVPFRSLIQKIYLK